MVVVGTWDLLHLSQNTHGPHWFVSLAFQAMTFMRAVNVFVLFIAFFLIILQCFAHCYIQKHLLFERVNTGA